MSPSSPYGDPDWPCSFASPAEALAAVEASAAGDYGFLGGVRVAYADAKLAGWELAKLYARERGLPVVTVFPGTAVGPGDTHRAISALVDTVWEGRLRLSFAGSTAFVDSRDFARGALLALDRGGKGEAYVIAGRDEDNLSYPEFQDLIARLARKEGWHAQRNPIALPKPFLLAVASVAEKGPAQGQAHEGPSCSRGQSAISAAPPRLARSSATSRARASSPRSWPAGASARRFGKSHNQPGFNGVSRKCGGIFEKLP